MANWSVTQGQLTTNNITAFGSGGASVIHMTISTVVDGVETYYNIEAANFIIGGTSLETELESLTRYVFQQGNMDTGIEKVVFTNNGIIGQPDNTVNVAVHLSTDITGLANWPSSQDLYIDIDDRPGKPPAQDPERPFCIKVEWDYNAEQTVSFEDFPTSGVLSINEALIQGDASTQPSIVVSGKVGARKTNEILNLNFEASSGHYYANTPTFSFSSNLEDYGEYYSSKLSSNRSDDSLVTSFAMQVYYTPPETAGLLPDPYITGSGMCQLSHAASVEYTLVEKEVVLENHITAFDYAQTIISSAKNSAVRVVGITGTLFEIVVYNKTSGKYFDWNKAKWEDTQSSYRFQIGESGEETSSISYEANTSTGNVEYDIYLNPVEEATTFATSIPIADSPGTVTQEGNVQSIVSPYSADSTIFATFATGIINRKKPTKNSSLKVSKPIRATGGNGGSSSTKVVLQTPVPINIAPGQIVTVKNTANASIITHNTTVVNVRGTVLTLSAAAAVPNGTEIRFDNNDINLEAFDFTITAGTSRNVAPIADKDVRTIVSGISESVRKVGGGSSGTTVGFTSGTGQTATADGIAIGSKMTGDGVAGDADSSGTAFTIVTAVNTLANTITVAHAQESALTGVDLTFSNSDSFTANSGVSLIDAQVFAVDVNNVKLQGYFKVKRLNATGTIALNIDKIITNTAE